MLASTGVRTQMLVVTTGSRTDAVPFRGEDTHEVGARVT
ncbi:MAG: hypothetical protein QOK29_5289, partial [Rhodospirillaceae bacterium]|nr:hypothetical protein [Rhodospirillaceae bacterium]